MSDIAPLLILILFWVFFGSRLSKLKKFGDAVKKAGMKTPAAPASKQRQADPPADAVPAAAPAAPVRTPVSPAVPVPSFSESESAGSNQHPFVGSLGEDTLEGIDPCHDEQAREMTLMQAVPADQDSAVPPELTLSWARNDVVRGFLYGEILNRRKTVS